MEAYSEGLPVVFSSYGVLPGRAEIVPMLQMRKLKPENLKYGGRQWGTRTWTMFRLFVARGMNQAYLGICLPVCLPSMPSTVMAGLHCYPLPACDTKIHNSGMITCPQEKIAIPSTVHPHGKRYGGLGCGKQCVTHISKAQTGTHGCLNLRLQNRRTDGGLTLVLAG